MGQDTVARRPLAESLRRRVDILPASMIIAQAALESGWGRSQVTRESNNVFAVENHYNFTDANQYVNPAYREGWKL